MKYLFSTLGLLLFSFATLAQDPQTGVPPFSSIQSIGMDAINRQNLNVNFSIPISSSPGRGINFSFPTVNDSLLWTKSSNNNAWTPVVDAGGSPTWGWKTTLPVGSVHLFHTTEYCDTYPPQSSPHYMDFSYVDPAGTTHWFSVDFYLFATICGFPTGPRTGYATDGSGYYLDATAPAAPKVTTPAGAIITGTNWTDPNGNFFSATVISGSETDWKDSAGHTPLKIITGATSTQYQYPDNSGAYQTATLQLTSTNIKTNFACSGVVEYTGTANLPTELDLANGQKYLFTYEPVTYPSGRIVQQSFDAIGRLCAVGASGSTCSTGTTYAAGFSYNTAFQVTGLNYGNGVSAAFGFSADRLQLNSLAYTKGASTLFSLNYSYGSAGSNNGQIAGITDSVDNGRSVTYTYDALYRLSTATTTGSTNYPAWGLSMIYDRYGNRTDQNQTVGNPPTNHILISAATNRISGDCYDANGNLLAESAPPCPSPTYSYDAENHVVTYSSAAYNYDGHGIRVKKCLPNCSSPTTSTVYIFTGSQVIAEYDNGAAVGSPSREYVYSGATLLAKIDSSGTKYYHRDHLSNRLVTDSSGNALESLGHFPFGESWYNSTNDKLLFTTYERDAESGNDFAMARYNVNRLGRFLSPDPLHGDTSDPQSLNRYAYVLNDPCNLGDPLGLDCTLKFGLFGQSLDADARRQITKIFKNAGVDVQFVPNGKADFYIWQMPLPAGLSGYSGGDIALADKTQIMQATFRASAGLLSPGATGASLGTIISHEIGHLAIPCFHDATPDCGNQGLMQKGAEDARLMDPNLLVDPSKSQFTGPQATAIQNRCNHLRKYDSGPPKSPVAGGGGGGGGSDPYFMGYSGGAGGGGIPDWLFGSPIEVVTTRLIPY
jgi:RHS repeat-associated protein